MHFFMDILAVYYPLNGTAPAVLLEVCVCCSGNDEFRESEFLEEGVFTASSGLMDLIFRHSRCR